jgi:hypothetical protein
LPTAHSEQDTTLDDGPPLDTIIGRLGRVSMGLFPDDDIFLLIFDRLQHVSKFSDFAFYGCKGFLYEEELSVSIDG